jgi:hypothetical protein
VKPLDNAEQQDGMYCLGLVKKSTAFGLTVEYMTENLTVMFTHLPRKIHLPNFARFHTPCVFAVKPPADETGN